MKMKTKLTKAALKQDVKFKGLSNPPIKPSKTQSYHSPQKSSQIDDFPIDLTLENFYHPTANSQRPVSLFLSISSNFGIFLDCGFELPDRDLLETFSLEPQA